MKTLNITKYKWYIIWFMIWLSFVSWVSYASTGTIWWLFTKVWTSWKLVWTNIQDGTVWSVQISNHTTNDSIRAITTNHIRNNSINNTKLNNTDNYTVWWITVNGTARATSFLYTSDERYKENIKTLENSLDKVLSLRWVEYTWKDSWKKDIWFLAQDVEEILPELVNTDEDWYKSVQYWNIIWVLVEAIKEQQRQITLLEEKIK